MNAVRFRCIDRPKSFAKRATKRPHRCETARRSPLAARRSPLVAPFQRGEWKVKSASTGETD